MKRFSATAQAKSMVNLVVLCALVVFVLPGSAVADDILLGRPGDDSITVNVIPNLSGDAYFEYGTTSGVYDSSTSVIPATAGEPFEVVIDSLSANTLYYYRMQSRETGQSWVPTAEYSFHTQRAQGSTFTFSLTSDSHINFLRGDEVTWIQTLNNVAADNPDFVLDLGDTFAMRLLEPGDVAGAEDAYEYQRPFFDITSRSVPLFLASGNHEQIEGWHLLDPVEDSLPVISTNALKKYYLNPIPDDFYAGDTNTYSYLDGDQLREDYYAWTWGDALFVVLDPFWFSTTKPYQTNQGGGESDTTGSGDRWDWSLGLEQFNWLKQTIENSNAKFKFVFSHLMTGGAEDYSRSGANAAHFVEWGGYSEDGTTWEWDTERPGWGSQPIHQMMVANGVSAFFHGHDHQYAYEKLDGVVYQALPSGSFDGISQGDYTTGNGYTIWADSAQEPGHVRVTVSPSQATVDYIASSDGSVVYSYTIDVGYTISGYIEESDLTPVEGVLVSADSGGGSDTTDVNGYYEVTVPDDWSGTVTPTKPEYTSTPTSRPYSSVIADIESQNYTAIYTPDLTPPSPDPMTWAVVPYATGTTSISMEATTATDISGVEYYFTCTAGGCNDSGWQASTTYEDTGLLPDTTYTYTVTASDLTINYNATAASDPANATTDAVAADVVTITKAEYRSKRDEFKVEAISSAGGTVTLTVVGFGDMTYDSGKNKYKLQIKPLGVLPPCTAVVISTGGGSDSKDTGANPCDPGGPPETDPPTPDPATFAVAPSADSSSAISMTATTGTDASGPVEYSFVETSGNPGGTDSGWQTSPSYTDTGLTASTQYTYTVTMRDALAIIGAVSAALSVTTDPAPSGDTVTITKAEYKSNRDEFKVEATSSAGDTVTLTVVGFGDMTWKKGKYEYNKKRAADPGATVTVTSSGGGQDTANVTYK